MFFSRFDTIDYDNKSMKDLSIALVVKSRIKNDSNLFFWYQLEDWEKPETVAFDFYGSTHLNYLVLLMNDIIDPFWDWPLEQQELVKYCEDVYGIPTITLGKYNTNGYLAVKHWVKDGIIYEVSNLSIPVGALAVSHFEYEEELNNAKRRVKILHPELVADMEKELDLIFNG